MKLFTFLGKGNYKPTVCFWNGRQFQASYAPIASSVFLEVKDIVVFLTEEAHQENFSEFMKVLPQGVQASPVSIPLGRIFNRINTCSNRSSAISTCIKPTAALNRANPAIPSRAPSGQP